MRSVCEVTEKKIEFYRLPEPTAGAYCVQLAFFLTNLFTFPMGPRQVVCETGFLSEHSFKGVSFSYWGRFFSPNRLARARRSDLGLSPCRYAILVGSTTKITDFLTKIAVEMS